MHQLCGSPSAGGTDVVMPQMGESIFEGTITKWLKKVGDKVQRDEPLFEISTDKVDAEIPVARCRHAARRSRFLKPAIPCRSTPSSAVIGRRCWRRAPDSAAPAPTAAETQGCSRPRSPVGQPSSAPAERQASGGPHGERPRSSPLVRKIAKEQQRRSARRSRDRSRRTHHQGRHAAATSLRVARRRHRLRRRCSSGTAGSRLPPKPAAAASPAAGPTAGRAGAACPRMRSIIAQRMVDSKRTSAHVHTVFKVDMTRIVKIREKREDEVRAAQRREADLHAVLHPRGGARFARCRSSTRRWKARPSATTRT